MHALREVVCRVEGFSFFQNVLNRGPVQTKGLVNLLTSTHFFPDVGLGTDSFVKNVIATVASACVAALKEAGAISEKTALSIVPSIRTATNVVSSLRN